MASSSKSGDKMDPALVEQFMAVTGTPQSVAVSMLEACAGNLELAVGMHMDGAQVAVGESSSNNGAGSASAPVTSIDDDDDIRAPIPQRTEVLMEEDASKLSWTMKRPRRQAQSVFDGFRDFQSEAHHYEELSRGKRPSKKRNLEDLFRPPVDITFKGTFQNARDMGSMKNKWLLVNVQNVQEFPCQLLNRDVWSNQEVRSIIKDSFVFWQVYNDSEEGKRYMQFYKLKQWPYVAIIDPFTGENQIEWHKIPDGPVFCELAKDFLSTFPMPDTSQVDRPAKRQKREPSIVDATEEEQLKAAIEASLTKPSSPQYVQDSDSEADVIEDSDDEVETFSDPDDVIVASGPSKPTNGVHKSSPAKTTVHSSSPRKDTSSQSSSSSLSVQGHSIPLRDSLLKNQTSGQTPLSSHSSTLSSSQSSKQSALSSLSRTSSGATSEIRISPRDLLEAGSSSSIDSASLTDSSVNIWASSLPSTNSNLRDTDSPLEVNIENSLMDMIGGRDREVCTPEVPTPEVVDSSSSNSQSSLPDGENVEGEKEDGEAADPACNDLSEDSQSSGPKCRIVLRFPDNKREQIELSCNSTLTALTKLCLTRGFPPTKYELVTNFPRRQLSQLDQSTTLKDAGLFPQETVFVQDL